MNEVESLEFSGHRIEIRTVDDEEELQIDGKRMKVLRSEDGYNLYEDAFVPPKPTLLDAAKAYIEKISTSD